MRVTPLAPMAGILLLSLLMLARVGSALESPEWATLKANVASMRVASTNGSSNAASGATVGEALGPVLDWQYSLPLQYVRQGQSYVGPNRRLRRVMADMLAGKPVEVTVLGGSISTGAYASRKMDPVNPNDVFSMVRIYMQRNISTGVTFINNARSATKVCGLAIP